MIRLILLFSAWLSILYVDFLLQITIDVANVVVSGNWNNLVMSNYTQVTHGVFVSVYPLHMRFQLWLAAKQIIMKHWYDNTTQSMVLHIWCCKNTSSKNIDMNCGAISPSIHAELQMDGWIQWVLRMSQSRLVQDEEEDAVGQGLCRCCRIL
jgi:hypothetical protein